VEANEQPVVLKLHEISKFFGNIHALERVSLEVFSGQVLAMIGDNGAGKSTLIKILSGVYTADSGEIHIQGKVYQHLTPAMALQCGITTVYQDLSLVNCRDVASNVFLGHEYVKAGCFVDRKRMEKETRQLLEHLQINIPSLRSPVGSLSGGQRQALAVARAIHQGGRVIVLDEPTAAMGIRESQQVMTLINTLKKQGYAVILVSHHLPQVFDVADRLCILRHGSLVADLPVASTCLEEVVALMTGVKSGMGSINGKVVGTC
jgi:ABC-type sugar transport system ATPase subunit